MASNQLSNEKLTAALIANGTVRRTAEVLNVTEKTIYNRFKDKDFKELFKYSQADLLAGVLVETQAHITGAIKTIAEIMNDTKVNPQTRLQACQTMLNQFNKLTELTDGLRATAENVNKTALDDIFGF